MKRIFLDLWRSFLAVIGLRQPPITSEYVDDVPDVLKPNTVYIVREDGEPWCLALLCPCGCGQTIHLNR